MYQKYSMNMGNVMDIMYEQDLKQNISENIGNSNLSSDTQ